MTTKSFTRCSDDCATGEWCWADGGCGVPSRAEIQEAAQRRLDLDALQHKARDPHDRADI
jgi:hypothetical protein